MFVNYVHTLALDVLVEAVRKDGSWQFDGILEELVGFHVPEQQRPLFDPNDEGISFRENACV